MTKSANVAVCQGRRRVEEAPQALVGHVSGLFMRRSGTRIFIRGWGVASGKLPGVAGDWAVCGVEAARMYLSASVTRWYCRELV